MKMELQKDKGGSFSETVFDRIVTQVTLPLASARRTVSKQKNNEAL